MKYLQYHGVRHPLAMTAFGPKYEHVFFIAEIESFVLVLFHRYGLAGPPAPMFDYGFGPTGPIGGFGGPGYGHGGPGYGPGYGQGAPPAPGYGPPHVPSYGQQQGQPGHQQQHQGQPGQQQQTPVQVIPRFLPLCNWSLSGSAGTTSSNTITANSVKVDSWEVLPI